MAREILAFLKRENKTLSIVESCTGGRLACEFSKISGASKAFRGGIIAYQNSIKCEVLGISREILNAHSPYSAEVVDLMLESMLKIFKSDFAIATSGIAGPNLDESFPQIALGTIFIGVKKHGEKSIISRFQLQGSRNKIQKDTLKCAIGVFKGSFIFPKGFSCS